MDRRAPGAAAVGGHVFTAGGGGVLRRVPYTLGRSTRRRVLRLADGLTEVVPSSAITSTLAGGDGCYFAAPPLPLVGVFKVDGEGVSAKWQTSGRRVCLYPGDRRHAVHHDVRGARLQPAERDLGGAVSGEACMNARLSSRTVWVSVGQDRCATSGNIPAHGGEHTEEMMQSCYFACHLFGSAATDLHVISLVLQQPTCMPAPKR